MNTTTVNSNIKLRSIELTRLSQRPQRLGIAGVFVLLTGLLISLFTPFGCSRWLHGYLLSFSFFASISLGAIFFVVLQHLTGARWSVVTRRVAELLTSTTPILVLLILPIVIPMLWGNSALFVWNDADLRASDELIRGKAGYLNAPFFAVRCAVYLAVWILISRFYLKTSQQQDRAVDDRLAAKMRRFSGPSMIAFALTVNFAAFDWLMSLDPHWFSTIFGIYFFAGCAVAFFATLPIVTAILQRFGYLQREVTVEHYHDMGKLLFGFVMFWAYIAFSQYLLIWYANIPEETAWFLVRQKNGWQFVGLLLITGHFALPFCGLMSRASRRNLKSLVCWSVVLLVMHWVDLFWLTMPNASSDAVVLGPMEALSFVGIGAIWIAAMLYSMAGKRLLPTGDVHLRQSLAFHNI